MWARAWCSGAGVHVASAACRSRATQLPPGLIPRPACASSSPSSSAQICVGGIQSNGAIYSASNYGAQSVDIAAPAVGVYSTVPAYSKRTKQYTSAYASYSGTSMATPHVSGAAALYAAHHPGATAAQIKAAIMLSAVPTASVSGKCVTNGRLDVARMMQQPLV